MAYYDFCGIDRKKDPARALITVQMPPDTVPEPFRCVHIEAWFAKDFGQRRPHSLSHQINLPIAAWIDGSDKDWLGWRHPKNAGRATGFRQFLPDLEFMSPPGENAPASRR